MPETTGPKPRIVVDERERPGTVPGALGKLGVRVDFAQLKVGDYILTGEAAVERKTLSDLLSSIYDGRLFMQCSEISKQYKAPFLMVEGNLSELQTDPQTLKVLYSALASVALAYKLNLFYTESPRGSALALVILQKQLTHRRRPGTLLQKPRKSTEKDRLQLYLVSSLPGVGEKLAQRLLRTLKIPRRVFNASVQELARVQGVGHVRARRIEKALVTPLSTDQHVVQEQARLLDKQDL